MELEAIKHEYTNAQLECNAADERAKLLASEVIGLEEKVRSLQWKQISSQSLFGIRIELHYVFSFDKISHETFGEFLFS